MLSNFSYPILVIFTLPASLFLSFSCTQIHTHTNLKKWFSLSLSLSHTHRFKKREFFILCVSFHNFLPHISTPPLEQDFITAVNLNLGYLVKVREGTILLHHIFHTWFCSSLLYSSLHSYVTNITFPCISGLLILLPPYPYTHNYIWRSHSSCVPRWKIKIDIKVASIYWVFTMSQVLF